MANAARSVYIEIINYRVFWVLFMKRVCKSFLTVLIALSLTACNSGNTPPPPDQLEIPPSLPPFPGPRLAAGCPILPKRVDHVINLTGAVAGHGDIVGPFWIMLELKKQSPNQTFVAIVDDFA